MARNRQRAKARKQKLHRENIPGSLDHASGEVEEVEAAIVAGAGGEPVEPDVDDADADADADAGAVADADDALVSDDAAEPDDAVELDVDDEPVAAAEPDVDGEPVAAAEPDVDDAPDPAPAPAPKRSRRRRGKPAAAADPEPEPAVDAADDDDLEDEAAYAEDSDAAAVEDTRLGKGAGDVAVTPAAHKPSGLRLFNFFRACWAELQRVDWPDRRQVGQATAVVLGFVVVAGAFLGLADVVAQKVVDLIL